MLKYLINVLMLFIVSNSALAVIPAFNVVREIHFGNVMPVAGSCRMSASTGVIISYIGQNICILQETAHNGRYTIIANPNKIIRVKVLPNQNDGNGVIFNPYIEMVSTGFTKEIIYNNVGFKQINTGTDGIVELFMGGDLIISRTYPYGQTINFSFADSIEWHEDP
jgi:hypothetical protein